MFKLSAVLRAFLKLMIGINQINFLTVNKPDRFHYKARTENQYLGQMKSLAQDISATKNLISALKLN